MRLSDGNLRGRTIIAADGHMVGEITALFLNCTDWQVESLQIKLDKDIADQIGAQRSMFHAGSLDIPVRMVQSVGDTVVLSVPVGGLRDALPVSKESIEDDEDVDEAQAEEGDAGDPEDVS